ncbi:YecH family metal-binding protein [Vibrio algarum]|uniref:YecH family protein n=1 Tax=Vibrio algarum TaxID=3020714 RepID=A0ABT4YMC9_9VIBR|nr:YecH family metal-binding protein [Vibrio sp. KJ40-1]MDB1122675.1 YecH family protein [Vibrio sp. KJ40-1]
MNNVHGHKILEILSEKTLTRDEVRKELTEEFGENVQFHTCHSEGLSFDEIFEFFISKAKITVIDGKYSINAGNKCK